jgi:hypothetical protein
VAEEKEGRAAPLHEPVVVPRVRRSWPAPAAPLVDPPTYEASHDGAVQAATLAAAAESGAAWCDICLEEAAATARREAEKLRPRPVAEEVEPPLYPLDFNGAAQAATLVAAAESGVAWCDICVDKGPATAARE